MHKLSLLHVDCMKLRKLRLRLTSEEEIEGGTLALDHGAGVGFGTSLQEVDLVLR